MTTMWTTTSRPKGWPMHGFQSRVLAIFLGMAATIAVWYLQPKYTWNGMQRHYLTHYMLASAGWFEKYAVLQTVDRQGKSRLTIPAEVQPLKTATGKRGEIPFQLTDAAIKSGAVKLVNPPVPVDRERFKAFLRLDL